MEPVDNCGTAKNYREISKAVRNRNISLFEVRRDTLKPSMPVIIVYVMMV